MRAVPVKNLDTGEIVELIDHLWVTMIFALNSFPSKL